MPIDGIMILDVLGRNIIQSHFPRKPPGYAQLHREEILLVLYGHNLHDPDSIHYVDGDGQGKFGPSFSCWVEHNGLLFLCPASGDADPVYVTAFINTFIATLVDYLEEISIPIIKEHFNVIYELFEEMLDYGYPLTTERNILQDIVVPPSALAKLMAATGISGFVGPKAPPFTSAIPWRKDGIKYNNNEIYFDVIEDLRAIVNKNGNVVSSTVVGKIDAQSHLSGTPDLLLTFTNPEVLQDCAFHPCVRYKKWKQNKALSFVPPDGPFTLMEYRYGGPSPSSSMSRHLPIPFHFNPVINFEGQGGTIVLTLSSRLSTRLIENLNVTLAFGKDIVYADGTATNGSIFWFDPDTQDFTWEIEKVVQGSSHVFRGTFEAIEGEEDFPRISRIFKISFDIPQFSYSDLKVNQLRVSSEGYKPYKGVRGRASGQIEWRWDLDMTALQGN